jgi:pilus assembly protein CpaD
MKFSTSAATAQRGVCGALARILTGVALTTMLAGCYTAAQDVTGGIPDDIRSRHPIAINEGDRTVQLFIGSKRGGLNPTQRAEVLAFAQAWRREGTGGIIIDIPSRTSNEMAAKEALGEVRSILNASGIPAQAVIDRQYTPPDPRQFAPVRLNYPRVVADVGPCGLWPHDLGPSADPWHDENRQFWNFGCASQRNMASMVAEPADLVQPRASAPAYTARRSVALDKYRQGQSSTTIYTNADKGTITEVGK